MKLFFAAVVLAGLALAGCKTLDAAIDCHSICSRYSGCYDAKYDVGACESRCRGHSSDDSAYRRRADECSACISDRSCTGATFSCPAQCLTVVP
jgi:hypothetical protein